MKWLYVLVGLSLAAAFGLLWFGEWIFLLPGALGVGLFWVGMRHRKELLVQAGFVALALAAALSAWGEGQALALLTSLCANLAAWDIGSYILLLRFVGRRPEAGLTRRRILRLGVALISGWFLGAATLVFRLELGFGVVLILGLGVVLGLAFSMLYLRRQDESML
mgnify:CR=1 FL=1